MKICKTLLISLFTTYCLQAQVYNIGGTVTDASTGEHLISANIYNKQTFEGAITNYYGYYSLKQKAGVVEITCSYMGYKTFSKTVDLKSDVRLDIALEPALTIDEVIVSGNSPGAKVHSTQTGMVELSVKTIKNLPVLLGETDVVKGLQLMPGVQGGTEGTSGLYVRGGSADQNLILLDGVPVYNVNHLFGIFSVFNGDALNSVSMYKGGFPARFGGRLSSVVDVRMKEGNKEKVNANATIGLLASKLTIDGPINDKTTFLLSGRRTYFDLFTYPFQILASKLMTNQKLWVGYYFYDLNAKISHQVNAKNRLYLSSYSGGDNFFANDEYSYGYYGDTDYYKDKFGLKWGNITTSARWNHIIRNDLFSNLTFTYTRFKFKVYEDYYNETQYSDNTIKSTYYYEYFSQIQDLSINYDIDYAVNPNHYLRFGASGTMHLFSPGVMATSNEYFQDSETEVFDTAIGTRNIPSVETHVYIEDEFKMGNKLKFNLGLHHSSFSVDDIFYQSLEPRLSGRFLINNNLSFKMSFVTMKQYLMLLTSNSMSLPTDLWIPVEEGLKPQTSWQTGGGFSYSLNNKYLFTLEGFYKEMHNVTEYKEGTGVFNMQGDYTNSLTQGYGNSYGIEFFTKKSMGNTNGWISYTLAWANRKFNDVGEGKVFPYRYDRRHQLNIVVDHKINEKWNFGTNWVFGSGYPFTLGEGKFVSINQLDRERDGSRHYSSFVESIGNRNNYRMPNYHRLDINFSKKKIKKQRERTWSFGAYNTYFHQNPFMIQRGYLPNKNDEVIKQLSILVFVPYFRWNIDLNKLPQ